MVIAPPPNFHLVDLNFSSFVVDETFGSCRVVVNVYAPPMIIAKLNKPRYENPLGRVGKVRREELLNAISMMAVAARCPHACLKIVVGSGHVTESVVVREAILAVLNDR